jgi:hypothetical protein
LNAAAAVKKSIKNELTLAQKYEIIQFKKENPKATQKNLCVKFGIRLKMNRAVLGLPILISCKHIF